METLRNLLLYGGVEPDVYRNCPGRASEGEQGEAGVFPFHRDLFFTDRDDDLLHGEIAGRGVHPLRRGAGQAALRCSASPRASPINTWCWPSAPTASGSVLPAGHLSGVFHLRRPACHLLPHPCGGAAHALYPPGPVEHPAHRAVRGRLRLLRGDVQDPGSGAHGSDGCGAVRADGPV